jgi:hypothetical protein
MTSKPNVNGVNTRRLRLIRFRSFVQALPMMLTFSGFLVIQEAVAKAQPAPAQSPAPATSPTPPSLRDIVEVTEVYNLQYAGSDKKDSGGVFEKYKAGLNDIIVVQVKNLVALLQRSKCEKPYDQDCLPKDIILYLDGRPFKGLKPESGGPTLEELKINNEASTPQTPPPAVDGRLRYHLQRDAPGCETGEDCKEYWADLLGLSTNPAAWSPTRAVEVSVGLADEYPVRTRVKPNLSQFYLIRVRPYRLPFWIIFTLLCIAALIWLAAKRNLLRDRAPVLYGQTKPFSLSSVQAASWFMVIIICFIFIWLITGQYDFSSTALILLGIGSGTALTASLMDSSSRTTSSQPQIDASELNKLLAEKEKLEKELNDLVANGASQDVINQKKADYNLKIDEIKQKFPNAIGPPHSKFYMDLLSDESGVNFHRFQMLIWTIVLSVFFVVSVLAKLAMPEFSTTLLMLMGISAGTYLGFKVNENSGAPAPGAAPADPAAPPTAPQSPAAPPPAPQDPAVPPPPPGDAGEPEDENNP